MSHHPEYRPRGMYFEDFEIGKNIVTSRRTVTQTDIVNFACLSGDHNAPHIDHEFCKTQPYGEPIAHGPLVLAMVGGLQCLSGINDGTIIAMMGLDQWRMHLPPGPWQAQPKPPADFEGWTPQPRTRTQNPAA